MGVNWELFERLSTIGTTLDNRIVVANTSKGVTISIGGITFEHIPKYLDHALYVPYIRTILLELSGECADTLGLCHVLAATVWYIAINQGMKALRIFGLPVNKDGRGNLILGKWGSYSTEARGSSGLYTSIPANSLSAISANRTHVMKEHLGVMNHPNSANIAQKAYTLSEQVRRELENLDSIDDI